MQTQIAQTLPRQNVVIITGPSGAGRSTAINALEDLGFEAIDNLPISLLERLFAGGAPDHPVAIGIDARTRGFSATAVWEIVGRLGDDPALDVSLVFVDCSTDVLLRRYSETRRRHPLAPNGTVLSGITKESEMLTALRPRADVLVDTSDMSPHDLRAEMSRWFGRDAGPGLAISVQSFSFKRGTPRSADMVLDCRFLRNPHWNIALRSLTGQDAEVIDYVTDDPLFHPFHDKTVEMLHLLLPAYKAEGKSYFTVAFGCTGGRHRSVCIAESVANRLAQDAWQVSIRHRELEISAHESAAVGVVKT